MATLKESLTDWTDIDGVQHRLAEMIGIVARDQSVRDVKALYWSNSAIGNALAELVFALVKAGVLEEHPTDHTIMRWNATFEVP